MVSIGTTPSSSCGRRDVSAPDVALVGAYPDPGSLHSGRSGVTSYTANLARALHAEGARVTVIADRGEGQPREHDDDGVAVQRPFTRGMRALPHARAAAAETGAAVVHVQHEHFLYGGPSALPSTLLSLARFPRPLVVTMHQVVDPRSVDADFAARHRVRVPGVAARAALAAAQNRITRTADAVVVHEPAFATQLDGAAVIPHGVEVVARVDRDLAREALRLDDRCVVVCFGYLAPYKGLETAIAAVEHAGPAVQLVLAGGEHPRLAGRDPYAASLQASAPPSVRFTGFVPEAEVPLWFSGADLLLLPHHSPFSSSGALALALAYGTPVLLSSELAACVAAPDPMAVERDPQVLGGRLQRLALDPTKAQRLRDAAASFAAGRTWPEVARRHLELYEEVTDGNRAPGRRLRATQPG
jgi:glycosyltransferase involved in cell wall biosynthesis